MTAILTVSPKGKVTKVQVVKKAGNGFDALAEKYFKRWVFKPAIDKTCVAKTAKIRFNYQFSLSDY